MDINRRNFLKGALVTGAAAAAAVALPACSPAAPSDASDAKSSSKGGETTGAKHTWEVAPEPIADIAETQDFDVVVVGAGLAGINAAEAAARNGAKTVVIERNTTFSVRGVDVGHIGSKYHKSNGFDLDPRVAARFLHQASHQTTNYDLIYVWASRSGEVFDYIEDLGSKNGVSMVPALSGTAKYGNWSTLSDRWRVYPDAVSFVRGGETYDMRDDGQPVNVTLGELVYNSAVDNGAEFVFEARAEQLVGDAASGITGVVATTKDGKHVQYNAKKGVILATGDIGGNQEMVDAFCPISNRSDSNCYAPAGFNNGDGLLMGMWAGAAMSKSEAAPMIHQFTLDTLEFNLTSFIMSWLAVNANGERYGAEMPFEPMLTNARMNTPGNVAWSIFDSDYETYIMQQQPERYDRFTDGLDAVMEKWLGNGKLIKADTLDDLAKQLDIPADTFKATVERYNSMAEAGEDVDFDVPAQWLAPVKTAPFYATKNVCSTLTIPFGLHVNADSQVLTAEDEPIPGLFAIGDTITVPGKKFRYSGIPTFEPEHFMRVSPKDTMKRKQFIKGTEQIAQEGAIQIFKIPGAGLEEVIVGVVGTLQFDVFEYRMKNEYNVDLRMSSLPYDHLRLIESMDCHPDEIVLCTGAAVLQDFRDRYLLAFDGEWSVGFLTKHNPSLVLADTLSV